VKVNHHKKVKSDAQPQNLNLKSLSLAK